MRFRYDPSRAQFDVVTAIELGDFDRGYSAIDIAGKDKRLYSFTCSLYVGKILAVSPIYTKGKLSLVPKNKDGSLLKSKVEALDDPRHDPPDLLPPPGTTGLTAPA
jgi:5'-nucleotidase